ncbi:DNA/RNA helicase, DEAD/DEAH box type [Cordyceps fumosorosea ARSEF 2679]|uniref:RNA helicase n=1 Tax=Cordyceps fumosorosea (strain ARSEF 2679) TaxID=1081104 RepID=A0A167R3J8_CORFA|nr:DNA/RNA helicase, DEAD/DEAH box type [Cordyceps fumosorosea ARSEF 2679]OAA58239.1 DNA/RNA helicase, DEAD/DEAH box type [Cordyceps fumosorosea ARSEF 2679]
MADLASRITKPDNKPADAAPASGADATAPTSTADAQVDGAPEALGGSGLQEPEWDVEVSLSDLQNNEATPFHSATTWEDLGLSPDILKGLLALNFLKPSKVQGKSLPLMLSDPPRNMLAQSQSGTGKTGAFVTAILSRVDFKQPQVPQALALAPSRELARQIEGVITAIGRFIPDLKVAAAIPGALPRGEPVRAAVIVGTPGTVMDIIRRKQLDASTLKVLVLDEADNMLDQQGLGDQCMRVKGMLPKTIQTLLFSATFPDKVNNYAGKFAPNAHTLKLQRSELTVKGISQMFIDCPDDNTKYDVLCKLYGLMTIGQSVIFVKTRESANEIQRRMVADGHKVSALHAAFDGGERDDLLTKFRTGENKVLITTNVLARGIDVSSVSMVINYDIPMKGRNDEEPDYETYLHRIGRTGRFGRVGVSISFVYDKKSFDALSKIADQFGIDLVHLDTDDWDEAETRVKEVIKKNRAQANYAPSATDKPGQPAPSAPAAA